MSDVPGTVAMPTMLLAGAPVASTSAPAGPPPFDPWGAAVDTPLDARPLPVVGPDVIGGSGPDPAPTGRPPGPPPTMPKFPEWTWKPQARPPASDAPAAGDELLVESGPAPAPASSEPASDEVGPEVGRKDGLIPAPGKSHLTVGKLNFNLYGGLIAAGGIAGGLVALRHMKSAGVQTAGIGKVLAPAVAAGIVGARLYHVATQWDYYKDHLGDIPKIWEGGMAIYGGLMAGTAVGAILARRAGLPIAPLLDAAAIGLPLAQAVGRWGNYANQELFGRPTDLPWGLQVDPEYRPDQFKDRNSFHPTFLYESLWNAGLAAGTFALSKAWKGRPPGMLFMTYLGGYAVGRFVIEGIRTDQSKEFAGLRTNQWTSLGILGAAGTGALLLAKRARG